MMGILKNILSTKGLPSFRLVNAYILSLSFKTSSEPWIIREGQWCIYLKNTGESTILLKSQMTLIYFYFYAFYYCDQYYNYLKHPIHLKDNVILYRYLQT